MQILEVSWFGGADMQVLSRMFFAGRQNNLGGKGAMGPPQALQNEEGAAAVADSVAAWQLPDFIPADLNMSGTEGDAAVNCDGVFDHSRSKLGAAALCEGNGAGEYGMVPIPLTPTAGRASRRTISKTASICRGSADSWISIVMCMRRGMRAAVATAQAPSSKEARSVIMDEKDAKTDFKAAVLARVKCADTRIDSVHVFKGSELGVRRWWTDGAPEFSSAVSELRSQRPSSSTGLSRSAFERPAARSRRSAVSTTNAKAMRAEEKKAKCGLLASALQDEGHGIGLGGSGKTELQRDVEEAHRDGARAS